MRLDNCWGSSYIIAILLLGRVFYSNFQGGSTNGASTAQSSSRRESEAKNDLFVATPKADHAFWDLILVRKSTR